MAGSSGAEIEKRRFLPRESEAGRGEFTLNTHGLEVLRYQLGPGAGSLRAWGRRFWLNRLGV